MNPRPLPPLRPVAGVIDRFVVPLTTSALISAIVPYLGVPISSPWRTVALAVGLIAVCCGLAVSPIGGLGLRLTGLRLVREDGSEIAAWRRALVELAWLAATFGPLLFVPIVINTLVIAVTGASMFDPLFHTRVVPINAPLGVDTPPTLVPAPPLPIPDSVTEVNGLAIARGGQRIASTVLDFVAFNAFLWVGYLLPATGLLATGPAVDATGKLQTGTLAAALVGAMIGVLVLIGAYLLTQAVLLLGWSTTIGKKALGLRIVNLGGGPASVGQRLVRVVVSLGVMILPFGPLLALVNLGMAYMNGRLPFHDRISRTAVVSVR